MVVDYAPRENYHVPVACADCRFHDICGPESTHAGGSFCLAKATRRSRTLQKGESVYRSGMRFNGIYALKSGSAKLVHTDSRGREAIMAVLLPGELAGFDGLSSGNYRCSLVTLETSSCCDIPAEALQAIGDKMLPLRSLILRRTGEQIEQSIERIAQAQRTAEERLAGFLLDLGARYHARGYSGEEFNLPLTRQEIGNHLGLALETVCRLLTRFESARLVEVDGKFVKILSMDELRKLAGHLDPPSKR